LPSPKTSAANREQHQGLPGRRDPLLLAAGFLSAEISHTGTNLSDRDFGALLRHPGCGSIWTS
jgi:hypothetical protein